MNTILIGSVLLHFFSNLISGRVLGNGLFRLDAIHYNDFHARFEETTVEYPVCTSNDSNCLGGYARLYYVITHLLKEKPGALLLNAGDTFQGTYWYTLLKWNITQKFINLLPNDVHTIGNHEFDDGIAGLAPYLAALHAPVVVANIDTSKEPSLSGLYTPHVILERRGRKIGVIGLITTETQTSSNPGRVKFLDPIKTVKMEAQLLTDRGIDIIIVLSHCGLEVDKKIAKLVGENIDIIIGGHSHSLLWNGKSPSNEYISGPYPVVIESEAKPGHKIPIVTASAFSKYVGNLTMYFDRAGDLKYFGGKPVFLNRSIPEDLEIKRLLEPYKQKLHAVVNEEVGYTKEGLIAERCGQQECAIGDLIADAFLNKERELIDGNLTSIAFLLRNMIRGSIPKGGITRGELLNTLPFTNSVVTFLISGRYLIDTFKICMTNFWQRNPFSGPWMPQIAGFKLKINLTEEVDVNVFVKEGDEYQLMNPDKEYRVTTLTFLIRGGNAFSLLLQHGRDFKIIGKEIEIVEEYVRKISPITPTLDNRLVVINTKSKNSTYQ
ncbi:apyrase-like [Leptidea sinapis]|uniref:apyrase-like n=1 Tax=Leptidea sinapis TaxID=189913 RepID=UPI002134685D|nr:apyrase-like [Leptidea sinapis]